MTSLIQALSDPVEISACVRNQGFAVLATRLAADEVAAICARLTAYTTGGIASVPRASIQFEAGADPHASDPQHRELSVRKYFQFAQGDPLFWSVARDQRIVRPIETIVGLGIRLLQSMALVKPPEVGSPKHWHQDTPYFALSRTDACCGIWIALDQATEANGCMQFAPGSHRRSWAHVQGPTGWMLDTDDTAACQRQAVPVPLPPGGMVLFDANTCHFTDANRSPTRRRALQLHYVSADTRHAQADALVALDTILPPWRSA
jgi:phytanoyl-CoA hydroxylase